MLDGARVAIGLVYARMHFRKVRDPIVRFTESVSRSRRALVVLPESPRDLASIQWVVRYLADRFAQGSMVVVVKAELASWVRDDKRYETVTYRDDDIGTWFVPRGELLRKVKKSTFDIAVDLNASFVLPSAYLCRESRAPVRISFAKEHGERFFNFQVQTKASSSFTHAYRNFLRCMEMF